VPGGKTVGETWIMKNAEWIIKHEILMIKVGVVVSAVVLVGVLIGLWQYGIDLSAVFLGPAEGAHEPSRGIMALEGAIVAVTLLFGGLFLAGIIVLIRKSGITQSKNTAE